jgi:hypothetical protein
MQDIETESLWSQISGRGMQGAHRGTELTLYPSSITTFADFKRSYPDGRLLTKPEKFEKGSKYDQYFSDSTKLGIFGRVDNFKRVPGKTKVIGLRLASGNIAVTLEKLAEAVVVLMPTAKPSVALLYDAATETSYAYDLSGLPGEQATELAVDGSRLMAGAAAWDIRSGNAIDGKSVPLKPVPIITAFWFAWASFFTDSELIQ